jgi:hypothetical protein
MPGSCAKICHDVVGNGELKLDVKLNEAILVYPAEPTEKQVHFLSSLDQNLAVTVSTVYFFNSRKDKKNHDSCLCDQRLIAEAPGAVLPNGR